MSLDGWKSSARGAMQVQLKLAKDLSTMASAMDKEKQMAHTELASHRSTDAVVGSLQRARESVQEAADFCEKMAKEIETYIGQRFAD